MTETQQLLADILDLTQRRTAYVRETTRREAGLRRFRAPEVKAVRLAHLETRASARTFSGYGSVFGVVDSYGDIVAKGAFRDTLKDWAAKGRWPAMLWQHDISQVIGRWDVMREDAHGLYVEGTLSDTVLGRDAYTLLKDDALSGLSIGFRTRKSSIDEQTGIRTLTEIQLFEISVVTFPANDPARVSTVKHGDDERATMADLLAAMNRRTELLRAGA